MAWSFVSASWWRLWLVVQQMKAWCRKALYLAHNYNRPEMFESTWLDEPTHPVIVANFRWLGLQFVIGLAREGLPCSVARFVRVRSLDSMAGWQNTKTFLADHAQLHCANVTLRNCYCSAAELRPDWQEPEKDVNTLDKFVIRHSLSPLSLALPVTNR